MRKLYGNIYSCGLARGIKPGKQGERKNRVLFRHRLKHVKVGTIIYNKQNIENKFKEIVKKYTKMDEVNYG